MGVSYKNLDVWQKSMNLVVEIYGLLKFLPTTEQYALSNQMRRAAVSVPSNIAEGQQRNSPKEFISFLSIAKGSLAELETQLILCNMLGYLTEVQTETAMSLCQDIGRMIYALINSLKL
ncbi:MAG: four helix bundle protein [Eubacterium sp.]|nr:four helix bundle protein [Eubacterium sp.]